MQDKDQFLARYLVKNQKAEAQEIAAEKIQRCAEMHKNQVISHLLMSYKKDTFYASAYLNKEMQPKFSNLMSDISFNVNVLKTTMLSSVNCDITVSVTKPELYSCINSVLEYILGSIIGSSNYIIKTQFRVDNVRKKFNINLTYNYATIIQHKIIEAIDENTQKSFNKHHPHFNIKKVQMESKPENENPIRTIDKEILGLKLQMQKLQEQREVLLKTETLTIISKFLDSITWEPSTSKAKIGEMLKEALKPRKS